MYPKKEELEKAYKKRGLKLAKDYHRQSLAVLKNEFAKMYSEYMMMGYKLQEAYAAGFENGTVFDFDKAKKYLL